MKGKHDFLSFLDSPTIAAYNKDTIFSPAEQAVLICHSVRPIEAKMAALQYLVDTYSEEEFGADRVCASGLLTEGTKNFRQVVCDQISLWRAMLTDRYDAQGVVFAAKLHECEYVEYGLNTYRFFSSFESAFQSLKEVKQEYEKDEDLRTVQTYGEILRISLEVPNEEVESHDIYRFDSDLRLVDLYPSTRREQKACLEEDYYVHVPTPFHRGDTVKVQLKNGSTFVGELCSELPDREQDSILLSGYGDAMDMTVFVREYDSAREEWSMWDSVCYLWLTSL